MGEWVGGCECEVVEVRMVECRCVGGCEWVGGWL